MRPLVTILGLGFLIASLACGGGGGGGGPTEPLPNPTISSVNPNQARPGEQVTITGSNLGGNQASVTFNGVAAQVTSASATSIVAIVPSIAAGPVTVTVTSGSKTVSFSGFSVLSPAPVVSSVTPNPVRAGGTLIITGQSLRASQGLVLSQTVMVLIDGVAITPVSSTNTEIQVQVPINVTPGNHVLRVQVDGEFSNSVPFQVEIFTVTGTYAAQGPVTINSCGDPFDPVNTVVTLEIAMTDGRPALTGRVGAAPLQGTMTSGGSFEMSRSQVVSGGAVFTDRLTGSMLATPQGNVGFSGIFTFSSTGIPGVVLPCSWVVQLIGARFTTVATSRLPSATMNVLMSSEEADIDEAYRNIMVH